jgi:hypothetical protein
MENSRPKPEVVLELFQIHAAPGLAPQSVPRYPAEREILNDLPKVATTDWGGPLVDRSSETRRFAIQIVDAARALAEKLDVGQNADDEFDASWGPGTSVLEQLVGSSDGISVLDSFAKLAMRCTEVLRSQPTLVHVSAPCKIFGDIHGQVMRRHMTDSQPRSLTCRTILRPSFGTSSSSSACSDSRAITEAMSRS